MATECAIEVRGGRWRFAVRPDVGGSLAGLWVDLPSRRDVPVLRPAPDDATGPLQMASFPLVPFCNRIEHGRFRWRDREVVLPPNHPGDPFPLHGYGWYAHWRVVTVEASAVELAWESVAGDWPWPYAVRQRYAIEGDAFLVHLSMQNRGTATMPAGLGHHPYFPRTQATRLRANLPVAWPPDARLIPTDAVPNPRAAEFESGCRIASLRLDAGYTGWDGVAEIVQPDAGIRVEIRGARGAFHLYVPDLPFFCAEAVSNQPNAINDPRAVAPMVALAPRAWLHYELRLAATPLG
jgi:aldose 1-epimerase